MIYKIIAHMAANDRAIIAEGSCGSPRSLKVFLGECNIDALYAWAKINEIHIPCVLDGFELPSKERKLPAINWLLLLDDMTHHNNERRGIFVQETWN